MTRYPSSEPSVSGFDFHPARARSAAVKDASLTTRSPLFLRSPRCTFKAAGFIATSVSGWSPAENTSCAANWIWYPDTPAVVPAGARISAGKSGKVARSFPCSAASPHGVGRAALAADARSRISRSGEALVEGRGGALRRWRRVGHGPFLRARPPLPDLHEARGAARLHALLAGRIRFLHRGDLPRNLSLRVEARAREAARRRRIRRGGERGGFGALRHDRQRMDERAAWISRRGRAVRRRRSIARDGHAVRAARSGAWNFGRVPGDRHRGC